MLILNPNMAITYDAGMLLLEDQEIRLSFHGESAAACRAILDEIPQSRNIEELSSRSGFSAKTVGQVQQLLINESFVVDVAYPVTTDPRQYLSRIRECALFWNRHIMAQSFPRRLFGGEATSPEVLGWGIEFYFFVKAAREYMALGSSRVNGSTPMLAPLWDHFAEEAFHSEMFLAGLVECGLRDSNIRRRLPLPTTAGLLNFLYETSAAGILEYTSLFAVMQPLSQPATQDEIAEKYDFLRGKYSFAKGLFNAFEKHDSIDVALGHSELALEPVLMARGGLSEYEWKAIMKTLEDTANFFIVFFEGIQSYYRSEFSLRYRQVPNAIGAFVSI